MDYEQEIQKHKDIIESLKLKHKEELINKEDSIVGKYYHPAVTEWWHITKVLDVSDDGIMHCEAVVVFVSETETSVQEDELYSVSDYHREKCEITKEEFNEALTKSINAISYYR